MKFAISLVVILLFIGIANAGESKQMHPSKYAGEENRDIKSLSKDDISELLRGGGWGFAKAAELNGIPGPAHLLELKDKIPLDDSQVRAIEDIFQKMKSQAIQQGKKLIALESDLEQLFRGGSVTKTSLRSSLLDIANARMELRLTHLSTHLQTPDILSLQQISKYKELRGYSGSKQHSGQAPGHSAKMHQ